MCYRFIMKIFFFSGDILFKREERHNLSGRGEVMDWCEQREVHGRVKLFFQLARGKPCRYYAILFKKQMLQMFYVIFFMVILWPKDLIFNIFWILPRGGAVYSYVIDPSWCVCYEQMQMRHQWHPFYFSFSTREYARCQLLLNISCCCLRSQFSVGSVSTSLCNEIRSALSY